MRKAMLVLVVAVLGAAQPGFGRGLIAEGGGFALTPDDLRFEVRQLGPSYSYESTFDGRKAVLDLLTSRFFLAESALARGFGDEGLTEAVDKAERGAIGAAYRAWRIDKAIRVPRAESKQVLAKLDRSLLVKEMVFSDYEDAARVLNRIEGGEPVEQVIASLAGAAGVVVQDPGWRIWREFDRSVAVQVFDLEPGQTTGVMRAIQGHAIYFLAEAKVWGEAQDEMLYQRARRFVRWLREAEIAQAVQSELSRRYSVRYNPEGLVALGEAFKSAQAGRIPLETLLTPWLVRYDGRDGEVVLNGAYFFAAFWTLPASSQPYVGDKRALEQFALDVILPDMESAAGYDLGLGRLRDVVWGVKQAREEYLIPRMQELLIGGVQLAPGEAEAFFEARKAEMVSKLEYRMRRILVQSPQDAQSVLAELRSGRDFAEVAGERSIDTTTGPRGGDLGNIVAGMFKYYDSLAVALDVGEVSDPHVLTDGVEILKLEGREMPRPLAFEEARTYAERVTLESKTNRILSAWVNDCKRDCDFRVDEGLLAAVDLPQPDWMASVVQGSQAGEEEAPGVTSGAGSGPGAGEDKTKPEGAGKQRPGKKRMIKRQR